MPRGFNNADEKAKFLKFCAAGYKAFSDGMKVSQLVEQAAKLDDEGDNIGSMGFAVGFLDGVLDKLRKIR